jgi:hypothetical protein
LEIRGKELVGRSKYSASAAVYGDNQFQTVVLDANSTLHVDKQEAGFHDTASNAGSLGDRPVMLRKPAKLETDLAPK